jgi:hypothetical protein
MTDNLTDAEPISEERLRNTRSWAAARPDMSGSSVIVGAIDELLALREQCELQDDKLYKLREWAAAYPVDVFPVPDWKRVHEVLKAAGLSLDQISAFNMRYVTEGIIRIIGPHCSDNSSPDSTEKM